MSASQAAASETLAPEAGASTTATVRKPRRWWIIAIFVIAIAAVVAGWYFWFGRSTTVAVHYLTATASTGTIAQSVQADFTLGSTNGVTTIALGGTSASSSSSNNSTTANTSTGSSSSTTGGGATASLASSGTAAVSSKSLTTFAAMNTGGASLADVAAPAITALIPTHGPVGSSVTLVGSGFTGASAVAFNGRPATFTVNSDTQITAIVPSGATSGPLTVTAPGGTATSAASFTVKPTPTPTPTPTRTAKPTPSPRTSVTTGTSSGSGSALGGGSSGSASSSGSATGSALSASSGISGIVTRIWLGAGATPRTLQRLLTVSGTFVYAFVSPTPLWKDLSTDLATGSERSNVIALQRALKRKGYYTGSINGNYTSATAAAYKSWQADQGMTETGVVTIDRFVWVPKGSVLTAWSVGLGNQVSSGTALASVVAPHRLSATALISQADIGSLQVGQKAQMTIDGYTSDTFTGIVSYIASQPASSSSSAASSGSTQYSITIRPRSLPKAAKSGMTGTLEIVIAQRENVLLVPTSAVSGTGTTSYVRVMMDGKPVYRQVQTGMATSSYTQITSGLAAGEVVVTGEYSDNATSGNGTGTNGSNGGGFFREGGGGFPQGGFPQGGFPVGPGGGQ